MNSEVAELQKIIDALSAPVGEPRSYYEGVDPPDRVISRNAIVFDRTDRKSLQQKNLANRMHHRYVLIRVLRTRGAVSVDAKRYALEEGDALLVMPYQFHHFIDIEAEQLLWLIVTFELASGSTALSDLGYRRIRPDVVSDRLWLDLVQLWKCEELAKRVEVLPVLDRLLTRLQSLGEAFPVKRTGSADEWVTQIESLVIRSVQERWTLREVAARVGYSERHLRERFEREMGLSLSEYRSNYQLHRAMSLMRDSRRSLSEIAELSGFNSQSVFTRFIRRMVRERPRELRRRIREGES